VQDGATRCLIGLGGNTGPVEYTFGSALAMLEATGCRVVSRSQCYQSAPMGSAAGGTYTNAAACVITDHGPLHLLDLMQQVECDCGRERTIHWGPRTLDLDLLFYGQQVIDSQRLTVPHPGLWYRRFVLDPLVEISPEWEHPGNELTVEQLRARMDQRPLIIEVEGLRNLPPFPERYQDGVVDVRRGSGRMTDTPPVQERFCCLRVTRDHLSPQTTVEFEPADFEIPVRQEDVTELLDGVLVAALGY